MMGKKAERVYRYIGFEKEYYRKFDLIMMIFWILFSIFSAYEGYLPVGIGGMTRYILLLWLAIMILKVGCGFVIVKTDQFLWLIWLGYYFISLTWTGNISQAQNYILSITLMTFLCVFLQFYYYGQKFCEIIKEIFKLVSLSVAFLSIFLYTDIGAGTRRVLFLFNTYIDPNNQVAIIAIGSGLYLHGIFDFTTLKERLYNMLGFIVCCYSIFQTGSRSGIVVLVMQIMIIIFFWHSKQNNIFKESMKWLVFIILGIIAAYFMNNYISSDIIDRLLGRGNLIFFDGTQREERWAEGFKYFLQHPIMGNGWGTFECHNTFLTMLVDVGILGNLFFYMILLRLYINAFKTENISAVMILSSGLLPAFFIGAQNKRFFWAAIILTSILINCKGEQDDVFYYCK